MLCECIPVDLQDHCLLCLTENYATAAVYKVEGLKRDFNAHNKLIGQYRKVRHFRQM